jgi:Mce-associated membrane protein
LTEPAGQAVSSAPSAEANRKRPSQRRAAARSGVAIIVMPTVLLGWLGWRTNRADTTPAVASVSATPRHAMVLVFIDQTVNVGNGAPTAPTSAVSVTLDSIDAGWLIPGFDPV